MDPGGGGGVSTDEETDHVTSVVDTTFLGRDVVRIPSGIYGGGLRSTLDRPVNKGNVPPYNISARQREGRCIEQASYRAVPPPYQGDIGRGPECPVNEGRKRTSSGKLRHSGDSHGILRNACRSQSGSKEGNETRYGLPRIIVTDNGAQLVSDPFKSWCKRFEIQQMNTAVAHPQANGLVERANRSLMEGIKTRLGREKAGWVDELPNESFAYRRNRQAEWRIIVKAGVPSGKAHTGLQKRSRMALTSCKQWRTR
ncbi:reverse transcriptase domain-containing protein [Tanacetum coccineum]